MISSSPAFVLLIVLVLALPTTLHAWPAVITAESLARGDNEMLNGRCFECEASHGCGLWVGSTPFINSSNSGSILFSATDLEKSTGGVYSLPRAGSHNWSLPLIDVSQLLVPSTSSSKGGERATLMIGEEENTYTGWPMGPAGDLNHDGVPDLYISSYLGDSGCGLAWILLQQPSSTSTPQPTPSSPIIRLNELWADVNSTAVVGVVRIEGKTGQGLGQTACGVGDVSGDGIDDFLLTDASASNAYLIWGSDSFLNNNNTTTNNRLRIVMNDWVDGAHGVAIRNTGGMNGYQSDTKGDVNGDKINDFLLGSNGVTYLLFGHPAHWTTAQWASLDLDKLTGDGTGTRILKSDASKHSLFPIGFLGDINGDGFDEIGMASVEGATSLFVVFGKSHGFTSSFTTDQYDGTNGFVIALEARSQLVQFAAADINADGLSDILVSVPSPAYGNCWIAYVVLGRTTSWPAKLRASSLDGASGFAILGEWDLPSARPPAIRSAGDFNHDGADDIIIGAYHPQARSRVYLLYGGQVPKIVTNNPAIRQGMLTRITVDDIKVTQIDVTEPLTVLNVQHGFFCTARDTSTATTQFSMSDIQQGLVFFQHDATPYPPSYQLVAGKRSWLTTTSNTTLPATRFIGGLWLQVVIPFVITSNYMPFTTELAVVSMTQIKNISSLLVVPIVTGGDCHFEVMFQTTAAVQNFSWLNVVDRRVVLACSGNNDKPVISMYLTTTSMDFKSAVVSIPIELQRPPGITFHTPFHVIQDTSTPFNLLQSSWTTITSDMTTIPELLVIVQSTTHGSFWDTVSRVNVNKFTVAKCVNNRIRFVHDGSRVAPTIAIVLSDNTQDSSLVDLPITFRAQPLLIIGNVLQATRGKSVHITTANLTAIDNTTKAENITFFFHDLSGGYWKCEQKTVTTFTLAQLMTGKISFYTATEDVGVMPSVLIGVRNEETSTGLVFVSFKVDDEGNKAVTPAAPLPVWLVVIITVVCCLGMFLLVLGILYVIYHNNQKKDPNTIRIESAETARLISWGEEYDGAAVIYDVPNTIFEEEQDDSDEITDENAGLSAPAALTTATSTLPPITLSTPTTPLTADVFSVPPPPEDDDRLYFNQNPTIQ